MNTHVRLNRHGVRKYLGAGKANSENGIFLLIRRVCTAQAAIPFPIHMLVGNEGHTLNLAGDGKFILLSSASYFPVFIRTSLISD